MYFHSLTPLPNHCETHRVLVEIGIQAPRLRIINYPVKNRSDTGMICQTPHNVGITTLKESIRAQRAIIPDARHCPPPAG